MVDAEMNGAGDADVFQLPSEGEVEGKVVQLEATLETILEHIRNRRAYSDQKTLFDLELNEIEANLDFYENVNFRIRVHNRLIAARTRLNTFLDFSMFANPMPGGSGHGREENAFLEKIKLKAFDGNIRKWKGWYETFDSAVNKNTTLNNIQKFNHLTNVLTGKALIAVEGLDKTAANYEIALGILEKKFGDAGVLAATYYDELDDINPATSGDDQRSNLEQITKLINNLRALGIAIKQDIIKDKILSKFSEEVITQVVRKLGATAVGTDSVDARTVLEELSEVIRVKERVDLILRNNRKRSYSKSNPANPHLTLFAGDGPKCSFCSLGHPSKDCRKFVTLAARRENLTNKKLCLICLRTGHIAKNCNRKDAKCNICKKTGHAPHLCVEHLITMTKKKTGGAKAALNSTSGNNTFLETFNGELRIDDGYVRVRGIVDSGSTNSYIVNRLAKRLGLKVRKRVNLDVGVFGTSDSTVIQSGEVDVTISNLDHTVERSLTFRTTPQITAKNVDTCPPPEITNKILPKNFHYADNSIFEHEKGDIEILIGNNNQYKIICNDKMKETSQGPYLRRSIFGWIPTGDVVNPSPENKYVTHRTPVLVSTGSNESYASDFNSIDRLQKLESSLENLWNLESLGIRSNELNCIDGLVLEKFRETCRFEDDRYVVRWPWKHDNPQLLSNYRLSMARLRSMLGKASVDFIKRYDDLIQDQLKLGVIEVAPKRSNFLVHYLPHRGIMKGSKLRVVYDASAKTETGYSLNDMLHRGPVLLENLVGLLLNFRLHEIGLTADIEKAFLQVGLNEVDRDAVRFIWLKDSSKGFSKENIIIYRFARVPFGVISSPFLLNIVIQELLSSPSSEIFELCKNKFYVDNLVLSVPDVPLALSIHESLVSKLAQASFNLRDWTSNNQEFLNACKLPEISEERISILGMLWNRRNDSLNVKLLESEVKPHVTKRLALQFAASIYDPLGLFNPSILILRKFVQDCWKNKFGWDEPLTSDFVARWLKIYKECLEIQNIAIPRRYWEYRIRDNVITLHVFSDASKEAYACSAYLCFSNQTSGIFASTLCYSKIRLAPTNNKKQSESEINNVTIPKLELLGLLIGKRSAVFLRNKLQVKIAKTVLWTDSTIVLQWVNNLSILPKFIQNRVTEIRSSPDLSIRHVPGTMNPADIATRGLNPTALKEFELWWEGPKWLCNEKLWPSTPITTSEFQTHSSLTLSTIVKKYTGVLSDEFEGKFPSWEKSVMEFESLVLNTIDFRNLDATQKYVTLEKLLIRELQKKYLALELKLLEKGLQPNAQLELFLQDGILRCRGRIQNASFPWDTIHPIFLPRQSALVTALITGLHVKNFHIGCSHLLAKLRERFWISKGRARIKSVIFRCKECRRWEGGHFKLPPSPPLPLIRVQEASPFLHVGVDLLGPVHVLASSCEHTNIVEYQTVHIALFTCFVTRAIHLEVVLDLSGDEFLKSLSRFTSRRGVPLSITSDNATNFQFVHTLVGVKVQFLDKKLEEYVSTNRILWKFIPQYSPWQGGAYERLVALVKRSLKKSYGFESLTLFEFVTALCEIENTINSRPLTYVSSDEPLAPLTPNNFIRLRTINASNHLELNHLAAESRRKFLITSWNKSMSAVDCFWEAFRSLYLLSLRERHSVGRTPSKNVVSFKPSIGDIVLIKEPSAPRGEWAVGTIDRLDKRQAVAHVKSGDRVVVRSINHLFPLEIPFDGPTEPSEGPTPKRRKTS